MKYYNIDGKEYSFNTENSFQLGSGSFGSVYLLGTNDCYKVFNEYCPVDAKVLEKIKNLKLHHYDSIKDIFYDTDGKIAGYIMNKYERILPDFYIMEVDEFLHEYNSLARDCDVLSKNQIFINDTSYRNTMSYNDKLKIVDYDLYRFTKNPKINISNNRILLWLWHDIFYEQRLNKGYKDIIKERDILPFFNPSAANLNNVREKLKGKKLVIDGFIRGK